MSQLNREYVWNEIRNRKTDKHLPRFPLPRFPPLQSGAAFSTPAISTHSFLLLPRFPLPRFQSPLRNNTFRLTVVTSLSSRLSSSEERFYTYYGRFSFLSPLRGLRGKVRCSC